MINLCWWCNKRLRSAPNHKISYAVCDQDGNWHFVHKACKAAAVAEIKKPTAQPRDES